MEFLSALAIYFIVWWISLFLVLPFGVSSQADAGEVTPGTERAAPVRPLIMKKFFITTLLSSLIFGVFYVAYAVFGITIEDIPMFHYTPSATGQ